MTKALDGVLVLDLTQVLAGPFAVSLLADFGADVIKIEPPKGSYYSARKQPGNSDIENARNCWNSMRNRRSLTINLKSDKGKQIFIEMVKKADIVAQNFSPGTMDRLGLGYDVLRKANKGIVYCAISGFGATGPYKDRLAYDPIIQATSGLMSITGFPENPPVKVGISMADYIGALYSVIGILIALHYKQLTGKGQMIDSGMFDALCHLTVNEIHVVEAMGKDRFGNKYPLAVLGVYMTKDNKPILFTTQTDEQWEVFLKLVGKEEIIKEKWTPKKRNIECMDEVDKWAREWTAKMTLEEAIRELTAARIPYTEISRLVNLRTDPQILNRELLVTVDDPQFGKVGDIRGIAPKLLGTPGVIDVNKGYPQLGQNTEEIMSQFLGYSREEISRLKQEGII